jgi:queuine tRNA-ribosyltransferase
MAVAKQLNYFALEKAIDQEPQGCPLCSIIRDRTASWLDESVKRWCEIHDEGVYKGLLFPIVQGNFFKDLRQRSAEAVIEADAPGIAIGGLSVGEAPEVFKEYLAWTAALLPEDKPRYVMGIGTPEYILAAIENGIDLFDCVLPTRCARNGRVFTKQGNLSIKRAEFESDFSPIDETCHCKVCQQYSRAYLRHLFKNGEILWSMLASYHNLYFLHHLVLDARQAIADGRFAEFKAAFLSDSIDAAL